MQYTQMITCISVEQDSTENLFHTEILQETTLHSVIIKASTWQLLISDFIPLHISSSTSVMIRTCSYWELWSYTRQLTQSCSIQWHLTLYFQQLL